MGHPSIQASKWKVIVIQLVFGLASRKAFDSFRHDVGFSADAHRHQVSLGLSLKQVGLRFFTPWRFYHHPSLGCLRPLLVQHYPWPFEPRIFMVRFLSFMYKIFTDISFMCRTFTEIQSRRSISVLLLEQVRTWVGRRLGWGGDTCSHISHMRKVFLHCGFACVIWDTEPVWRKCYIGHKNKVFVTVR